MKPLTIWYHVIRCLGVPHRCFVAEFSRTAAARDRTHGGRISLETLKGLPSIQAGSEWAPRWIQAPGVWVEAKVLQCEPWQAWVAYDMPVDEADFLPCATVIEAEQLLADMHSRLMGQPTALGRAGAWWAQVIEPMGVTPTNQARKVLEEARELRLSYTSTPDPRELADVLIACAGLAQAEGWDIDALLSGRLEELRTRTWTRTVSGLVHHVTEPEA